MVLVMVEWNSLEVIEDNWITTKYLYSLKKVIASNLWHTIVTKDNINLLALHHMTYFIRL